MATKNFATMMNTSFDKGYKAGHRAATTIVLQACTTAFCVAMNNTLGIGADRFERVRQKAMEYIGGDIVKDPELALERLKREYAKITGTQIDEVIN